MQAIATAELPSRISHEKIVVVFGGLLLVMLLAALYSTIVATALPTIVKDLGDLYGRKRVLQFAISSS